MTAKFISFGAAFAADVISSYGPFGGLFSKVADAYLEKRAALARDILIKEIEDGFHGGTTFEEEDIDPLIDILLRFSKAVSDGASKTNLRLLAQIVAGLKKNKALDGDAFRRWAAALEGMTRDELMIVGKAIVVARDSPRDSYKKIENFWEVLSQSMKTGRYSEEEIAALAASVSRHGLLIPSSGYGGGILFEESPWLMELGKLVNAETMTAPE